MKHTVKIEFKTSELIIKDWIRIDEFLDQVGPSRSLERYNGLLESTEEAAKHGFVRVHVGDADPTIHRKGDDFSFGLTNEKKEYENIGSVYVGVWAVTIIEKQKLIDIIANQVGQEKAEIIVKDYLANNSHTTATVEPGTYTLKFDPEGTYSKEIFSLKKDKVVKAKKMKM
jgi:hypothetical protein